MKHMIIARRKPFDQAGRGQLIISYFLEADDNIGSSRFVSFAGFIILFCLVYLAIFNYSSSIFGIILLLIGSYILTAMLINQRQIWFRNGKIILVQKPLPLYTTKGFKLALIDRAIVREFRVPPVQRFDICLELGNGQTEIFTAASNRSEAEEIVAEINAALDEERG